MATAKELGHALGTNSLSLVYGGGRNGIMGAVASSSHESGSKIYGVIPTALVGKSGTGFGETVVVSNMHERKNKMGELSDAFICLPGGYGTMEEVLEVITWSQLGIHSKPIILLNVLGFFDHLIAFVDRAVQDGFIKAANRNIFVVAKDVPAVLESLRTYRPSAEVFKLNWTNDTNHQTNHESLIG